MPVPDSVKGAPDWLPPHSAVFDRVEATFLEVARLAGYARVRTPVFEHTEVFLRSVGESTDIVQKEMYTFRDKGDRSLTLRPEGTAGVVRAALNAGVPRSGGLPAKFAYAGEFFRHERPQAGRQRQFNQVGIEALGSDDPVLDAEVVVLGWEALQRAGCRDVVLRLNNLGDRTDRAPYLERLGAFLDEQDDLPQEVRERRRLNPLRAFDSKAPGMDLVMASAPLLPDHVSDQARGHVATVRRLVEGEGIPVTWDPVLVRGLDYYTRTTFEYTSTGLGAQSAVGGGGRYDGLAEDLGWPERFPGIGWALGVDRTVLAVTGGAEPEPASRVEVFVVATAPAATDEAFALASTLRRAGVATDLGFDGRRLRAQLKAADRAGARVAVLIGPEELARGGVTLKDLASGEQRPLAREEVVALLSPTSRQVGLPATS